MKIENLENLANTLEQVCDKTKEITGQARYLTVSHILVELMSLADDNNINIDVELDNVRDCMIKLQSSIYEVHNTFKYELEYTKSRIEQIELDNERGVA